MALPDKPFICNYNAKNSNETDTLYQTDGQELYEDLTIYEGNIQFNTDYFYLAGYVNKVFDFNSESDNPFSFHTNKKKTFVFKVDGSATGPLFCVNNSENYEYCIYSDHITIWGCDCYYPDATNGNITSIYANENTGQVIIRSHYDDSGYNYAESIESLLLEGIYAEKAAFFTEDAINPHDSNFNGGFYWFYACNSKLTDDEIGPVINFNEYYTHHYLTADLWGEYYNIPSSGGTYYGQVDSFSNWWLVSWTDGHGSAEPFATLTPQQGSDGITSISVAVPANTGESRFINYTLQNYDGDNAYLGITQQSGSPTPTVDSKLYLGSNKINKFYFGSNQVDKIYLGSNLVYQQAVEPTITAMTLDNLVWSTNISWSGGTATSANCSYSVTAYYSNGTTSDVTSAATITGSQVVPKTYVEGVHSAGTLTLTATYSGYSAAASVTIMQNSYNRRYHPLVFDIISGGTIMWKVFNGNATANTCTIEYKLNDADWTAITATAAGVEIPVQTGDEIQFKGDNERYGNTSTSYPWVGSSFCGSTATFDLHGNIMALVNSDSSVYPALNTLSSAAFCRLFGNCNVRNADGLHIPTGLANYCYDRLFYGCTTLISAPELTVPTLTECCYRYMFGNCTSLSYIKCLATDISASNCTNNWVRNVSETGTFVKDLDMSSWTTGIDGIPSGWTIENNT